MTPALRRIVAWLLLAALGSSAGLPALAHALLPERATSWTDICTAQGMKRVPVHADDTGPPTISLHGAADHCPWCLLASDEPALPPAAPSAPCPPTDRDTQAPPGFAEPASGLVWHPGQPRGPPRGRG